MPDVIQLGSFGKTTQVDVTATAATFTCEGPYTNFYLDGTVAVCLSKNGEATVNDVRVPADTGAYVSLLVGEELSIIVAEGETDGSVNITEVSP